MRISTSKLSPGEKTFGCAIVLWFAFCIAIVVGVIYVAIHFLAKVW